MSTTPEMPTPSTTPAITTDDLDPIFTSTRSYTYSDVNEIIKQNAFAGPATAAAVTRWLYKWDLQFDRYPMNAEATSDKEKMAYVAASISAQDDDVRLRALELWYQTRWDILQHKSWDRFKSEVKGYLLGPNWRAGVLREFYRYCQDQKTLDEYFRGFDELRRTIQQDDVLRGKVSEETQKALLVFKARRALCERVTQDEGFIEYLFDLATEFDDIRNRIRGVQ